MRTNITRLFSVIILLWASNGHAQTKILFVGNSLTYSNDLPTLVENIAKADGVRIETQMIAFPNYALEDHWNGTNVSNALKRTKFDYIVFQQGPSAMPASRVNLIDYALKFARLCKANNATMAMYTVWPSTDRNFDFANVIKSYAIAADTVDGIVFQAGLAWQKILADKKDFPLYSSDGFHPTLHGSFLSAMVIYAVLSKKSNLDFLKLKDVPSQLVTREELDIMKKATLETIKD